MDCARGVEGLTWKESSVLRAQGTQNTQFLGEFCFMAKWFCLNLA